METDERIETLMQLGLTLNQARAYFALVRFGVATAKQLSQKSKITRPDIYRVIPQLQEKGVIEKTVSIPTIYKALPIEQVTTMLLQCKDSEQKELQRKAKKLMQDSKNNHAEKEPQQEEYQFVIIPKKEAVMQKMKEGTQKAQTSIDVVTSRTRFSSAILELAQIHKKALERGVKIRIATEKHAAQDIALKIVQTHQKNPNFKIKYFPNSPEAIVVTIDKKEAYVTMTATANLNEANALWSNNPSFVALVQNYFENKWNNTQEESER